MTPDWWQAACDFLKQDTVMANLIQRYPESILIKRSDAFETLLRAIVGQQISIKAADTIWQRLNNIVDVTKPDSILATSIEALRQVGLSARKVSYAQDLAQKFLDKNIRPNEWHDMPDAAIQTELISVKGIGPWTAEMFLIFHLHRPNIWPVDDIGLQRALHLYYQIPEHATKHDLKAFGDRFSPFRTAACWFLWRGIDPNETIY